MAHGWTPERRIRQAKLIHSWKPWLSATGPATANGKASSALNARRHGLRSRRFLDESRQVRDFLRLCRDTAQ